MNVREVRGGSISVFLPAARCGGSIKIVRLRNVIDVVYKVPVRFLYMVPLRFR